ncbi:hypothetical protein GF402_02755 [Candidatus Fermentibacteria bacterium]|nr:hypothetical protein [Candidatus Fermentibacteria bacterium]
MDKTIIVFLAAIIMLQAPGLQGDRDDSLDVGIPLVGRLLRGLSDTGSVAYRTPSTPDLSLIRDLINRGILSDHPAAWTVVRDEDE